MSSVSYYSCTCRAAALLAAQQYCAFAYLREVNFKCNFGIRLIRSLGDKNLCIFFLASSRVTLALRTRARWCFTSISRRKPMSELCLVTSGLWCYSKCQSQECHLGGRGMTLFTMCGAFLSKQCWVRSARWSAVMDASPGGCRNPRSEQCQTFSNEESGAVPVLQVTLEGGRCTHRSGLQSLLKPMFSEFQALSTLHFLAIK